MADPQTPLIVTIGLPVATLLAGFVTSSISDAFRDRRRLSGEREAREAARQQAREERADARLAEHEKRRDNFELEHLTAAYEAVTAYITALTWIQSKQIGSIRRGEDPLLAVPAETITGVSTQRSHALDAARLILQDSLRREVNDALTLLDDFIAARLRQGAPRTIDEANDQWTHVGRAGDNATKAIAARIRELVR